MPIRYKIIPHTQLAYIKAWGDVWVEDILYKGAEMFKNPEWQNGYNILCDYREITRFDVDMSGINEVVDQDHGHGDLFDKSKCAVVAPADLVYGMSRMWEILSQDTTLENMVFREMEEAIEWLELDISIEELFPCNGFESESVPG